MAGQASTILDTEWLEKQDQKTGARNSKGGRQAVRKVPKALANYIEELKAEAEALPDPNEGRIQELRDMIRSGKLTTKEVIRETAENIARYLLNGSDFLN